MIDLKSGYEKWKKIYIQQNAQFFVKRLTFQIRVKVHWQVMWKAKNIVNGHHLFMDPEAAILVKVKE